MIAVESAIAKKHIEIIVKTKQVATSVGLGSEIYLATHTAGIYDKNIKALKKKAVKSSGA